MEKGADQKILRTASNEEIMQIIQNVAEQAREQNNGYFYVNQVKAAVHAAGINVFAVSWEKLLKKTFHVDPLGPKQDPDHKTGPKPYNANDPVRPEPSSNSLTGMPDLGVKSQSVVNIGYRPGGQRTGGISPQKPQDLRDH